MKMITAIIKPLKFNDVKTALEDFGIKGMTVIGVRGFGAQGGHTEIFRGAEYKIELIEKIKLEICVKADQVEKVIEIILENARSGVLAGIGFLFLGWTLITMFSIIYDKQHASKTVEM